MKSPDVVMFAARFLLASLLLVVVVAFPGCSSGKEGHTAVLSGQVTLDSQPLETGSLLLLAPTGESGGAMLEPDGTFSLRCKPGIYQVAVVPPTPETGPEGVPVAPIAVPADVPRKYTDVATSMLTVEVADGDNSANFELTSR